MRDDDDEVGFDLSAWEAPPPPAELADAIIARVKAPLAANAVEAAPPRRSRWWIAGGLAAVIAGAVSIALLVRSDDDGHAGGSGAVATARPSHLELGGTAIDLEADTDVWWVRDDRRVIAMQPRGTATWRVGANERVRIDAGATVASVEASGASLRVEVDMNLSDARLIGTSAGVAAAVALVTVIVYEGHVKVTGGDRTVEVAAGSTVQVAPNQPPVEPERVSGRERRLESKIEFLELENRRLREQTAPATSTFEATIAPIAAALRRCEDGRAVRELTLIVHVTDDHDLAVDWAEEPSKAGGECVSQLVLARDFSQVPPGNYQHVIAFEPRVPSPPPPIPAKPPVTVDSTPAPDCAETKRIDDLEAKGESAFAAGQYATALSLFDKVLKCKPKIAPKAYLAACRAHDFARAKRLFARIADDRFAQICLKEGFDPRK